MGNTPLSTRRGGFTLIELLVVLSLIMLMFGLTVMFIIRLQGGWSAEGRGTVQQSVQIAKSRAGKDQVGHGMRLKPDVNGYVRELYYIEQPEPWAPRAADPGGNLTTVPGNLSTVKIAGIDLLGGYPLDPTAWTIMPGDSLEVLDTGEVHRITTDPLKQAAAALPNGSSVYYDPIANVSTLILDTPLPYEVEKVPTRQYRILRAPRLTGEEPVPLPEGVAIDLNTNLVFGNPIPLDAL